MNGTCFKHFHVISSAFIFRSNKHPHLDWSIVFKLSSYIKKWTPPPLSLRFWTCQLTWSITLPTCTCNMYHNHSNFWLCEINHQSQTMTQVPVIYHHHNIFIALWCNSYAHEIHFTIKHQHILSKTPQRSPVISILRWIFYNIAWIIENSPLKRLR